MHVLIIGGSSQDAYFLIHAHLVQGDRVFAKFRTSKSLEWRREQLSRTLTKMDNFFPVLDDQLDAASLAKFIDEKEVQIVYYLASINLPSSAQVNTGTKLDMQRIHVDLPLQLIQALAGMPHVRSVFPLSSKMFSLKGECDLIVSIHEVPNPQNYYGETRAQFWEQLKVIRKKYPIKVLSPILFNHESLFRFVHSREEKFAIQRLRELLSSDLKVDEILESGIDFAAREDWLHASDVSTAIYKLVQLEFFDDIIIGSGRGSSILNLLLDYLELHHEDEAVRRVNQQMSKFTDTRPCLIGDVRDLRSIVGHLERRIVLS